jgi:membrane-bound lytic murein transglycosylase F
VSAADRIFLIVLLLIFCGCDQSFQGPRKSPTLLEEIQQSGKLKVLTRFGPSAYFEGPEGFTGLDYELVQLFTRRIGVEAEFIVPENFGELLARIMVGDAHIAAAGITVTENRKQNIRFAPSYRSVTEQLIYRMGNRRPRMITDLYDGILEVINGTSHVDTLTRLKNDYPRLEWNVNPALDLFELLELVDKGLIDYTVANSNQMIRMRRFYPNLAVAFDISDARMQAWALPYARDNSLYAEAVAFFLEIKRNGTLDELTEKYFGYAGLLTYAGNRAFRKHFVQRFPKFRPYFEQAAREHGLDWRLLAAIGYQESHWDSGAVSPTGVRGIMMLTDATASQLGIQDRGNPIQSIAGGARYFKLRKKRISRQIPEPDQTWMALAAYNVGHGHLEDARHLTKIRGGDPNKWRDVKKVLPLLSQKRWYRKTKHGYARGREPVRFVENIRNYYDLMIWLTGSNATKKRPGVIRNAKRETLEPMISLDLPAAAL